MADLTQVILFPFSEYWWFYLAFSSFVIAMLVLDLKVFHKDAHVVSIKESAILSGVWLSLAIVFNIILFYYAAHTFSMNSRLTAIPGFDPTSASRQVALEFLTGFVIEKSLAIDNIFIFVVIFSFLSIPAKFQHRVLFFGVLGALVFRAIFIALGASLMQYHWVIVVAGLFLVFTGAKILFVADKKPDFENNFLIKMVKRFVPVTNKVNSECFFVRENNILHATPLFLALVLIEFSDIIFAIDSVPAIFAITKEPLIVFTSNIFAILGLRSLYFLLAGVVDKFRFLKFGLGFILIFVGLKMSWLNEAFGGKFPISWSLGIIGLILAGSVIASLVIKPSTKGEDMPAK